MLALSLLVRTSTLLAQSVEFGAQELAAALDLDQSKEYREGGYSSIKSEEVSIDSKNIFSDGQLANKMEESEIIDDSPKILVNSITVTGVESINFEKVLAITLSYEGQELTLKQLHGVAEEISDLYAKKGFVTSYAYIPEQDVTSGEIEILVVEGRVGNVIVVGNDRFAENIFTNDLIKRLKGKVLNYPLLKGIVRELNRHPDRDVSVSLNVGEEKGTTDIVVQVTEESLSHISVGYNRMGSGLTGLDRYTLGWRRSNFLGFDEQWTVSSIYGKGLVGVSGMYLVPLFDHRTNFGYVTSFSKVDVGGAHEQFGIEAKSKSNMFFLQHNMYTDSKMDIKGRLGLRVTDAEVRAKGSLTSHDDITVFFTDFDFLHQGVKDVAFVSFGFDLGIPDFLGSAPKNYAEFSRNVAMANFEKYRVKFDYSYRLSWDYAFIRIKGSGQYSLDDLVTSEQMAITGFNAVRGFEEGQFRGDTAGIASFEVYAPLPFFPNLQLPFADRKLKESVQFLGFFDYGIGRINHLALNETKKEEFKSVGFGLRIKLYKNMYARLEIGFPIHKSDRDFEDSKVHFAIQTELF
jgi:hemolysin activation/secretion protein